MQLPLECWTPHLVTAIVMTHAFCAEIYVKERVCRYIQRSDINALFKKHEAIKDAEARLKDCYNTMASIVLEQPAKCQAYHQFSASVVRLLMRKQPVPDTDIESMQHAFIEDLKRRVVDEGQTELPIVLQTNPYKSAQTSDTPTPRSSDPTARSSVVSPANFIQYDSDGKLVMNVADGLETLGLKPGAFLKKDDVVCTIVSVTSDGALCVHPVDRSWKPNPNGAWSISYDDSKLWKLTEQPENLQGASCVGAQVRLAVVAKSIIVLGMNELLAKHPPSAHRIQTKPRWGVFCDKGYKAGELVMVYSTINVQPVDSNDVSDVTVVAKMSTEFYKLLPHCNSDHVCPTWRVGCTDQDAYVNMQVEHRTVEVYAGIPGARKRPAQAKSVELPVLVNVKDVIEGDELLVFRQKKVEKRRVTDERSMGWAGAEPSAKKPRVGGG